MKQISNQLYELIMAHDKQILGIFKAHDLITNSTNSLDYLELTETGKSLIGQSDYIITDEWIKKWRELWPKDSRTSVKTIRNRLNSFLNNNNYSLNTIWEATEKYLQENQHPYCGKTDYFFRKTMPDKTIKCRVLDAIEALKEEKEDSDFISDNSNLI